MILNIFEEKRMWCGMVQNEEHWRLLVHPVLKGFNVCLCVFRGADKSLARPGRKQTTATKLLQVTQKQFRRLSVQTGLRGSNDLRVGRKMATFQLFFQSGRAKDLSKPLYLTLQHFSVDLNENKVAEVA